MRDRLSTNVGRAVSSVAGAAVHRFGSRPLLGLGLTCAFAALVFCILVGGDVLIHPGRAAVGVNPASDFQVMTWSLEWWPWAIRHGVNPLHTPLLWPPRGFSTLWMTTIPLPAVLGLPLTLTAGPLVAYNALILSSVPLAAGAAYLLCRELTGNVAASLGGGLLFGLSPYMLGHALSQHLDLTFVFPVPLLALLILRYVRGRVRPGRFVAGATVLLLMQLASSFELFLDLTVFVALALAFAMVSRTWRPRVLRATGLVVVAYVACLPVLIPIAVLALSSAHGSLRYAPGDFSIDVLNVFVPTPTLLAGTLPFARALSRHFVSNVGEKDGYLGIPLLIVALLAVRARWRHGAWLAGGLLLAGCLLSFGPMLTVGGRALVAMPFAVARLPLLRQALPARMSLFTGLAGACLLALWLAEQRSRWLRLGVVLAVLLSLLPNFRPPRRLPGAWSISAAFGWSTSHVPAGFVNTDRWTWLVPRGSTILVLPTGDRTAASYWQAKTAMSFRQAMPATPFVPPQIAAAPIVRALVNDQPTLGGHVLMAARLRAYLLADRISAIVVTPQGRSRWRRVVAEATAVRPLALGNAALYRVSTALKPLSARGGLVTVHATPERTAHLSPTADTVAAWLQFDGHRARLRAVLRTGRRTARAVTLSSPNGDADGLTTAAVDNRGHAAVIFTEWRDRKDTLRVATLANGRWSIVTLDRQLEPIWSPHVVVTPGGTTIATWIDQIDPSREVHAAARSPGGAWQRPLVLANADGLGTVALSAGVGNAATCAWHDGVANESRVQVATYTGSGWSRAVTLASSLGRLDHVTLAEHATLVRWWLRENPGEKPRRFRARREGLRWIESSNRLAHR